MRSSRIVKRLSTIAWRLPLLVSGLTLLVAGTLTWAAYREVRQTTLAASEQRLANLAGELVASSQTSIRAEQRRLLEVTDNPAVRAWLRAPDAATARRVRDMLAQPTSDSTGRNWQLISAAGDTLTIGSVLPGHRPDSTAIGRLESVGDTLHYAVTQVPVANGRILGRVVHWRRAYPSPATRDQLSSLGGDGTVFRMGSEGGAWSDLAQKQPQLADANSTLTIRREITGTPWRIQLQRPASTVLAPARRFLARIITVAILLSLLALAIAMWQGRRITAPLVRFADATRAMSGADYSQRVTVPGKDELAQLAVTFNAMAERMQDEVTARARNERQWRSVFASNPLPMWVVDTETWRFLVVNDAAVRHYGYSEAEFLAMTLDDIHPPEDHERLQQAQAAAPNMPAALAKVRHRRKDGSVINVELTSNAVDFAGKPARLALAQDVTQRLLLEDELRQAQKMEAVGRLAAGVAHDFNNVLAVIMNYAELLREELSPDNKDHGEQIAEIVKAATHASTLTRQLLTFSRQQVTRPEVIEINVLLTRMERMMRPMLNARSTLVMKLDAFAGYVRVDPAQLEQVVLNLVINAGDAMPQGGKVTIATSADAAAANVEIAVTDTGVGMEPDVQARIFDPFFTTKDPSKGTGLGLPTAYGIVTQAGGSIGVTSSPGRGSTFVVRLPRVAPGGRRTPDSQSAMPQGSETILLAEDEDAVRAAVGTILRRRGYTVLPAATPLEALGIADKHTGRLDLLLTDVVMPGLTGPALYARLREKRPDLKVLYMSGYAGDAVREHGLNDPGVQYLEKPFSMSLLAEKVRETLG